MADWTSLSEDFDYDMWANKRWLQCLLGKEFPGTETDIFRHILSAQEIWFRRVHGESLTALPEVAAEDTELERMNSGWKAVLEDAEEDRQVSFRRTTGEACTLWLSYIARHVVNHGTYHRGELRGLCRARGDSDFPESDFAGFVLMRPPDHSSS